MITAFSMRANGWVNFKMPNTPTPATITRGRAIAFPLIDAAFAYSTKEAAVIFDLTQPAIPREWAKVIHVYPGQDE